MAGVGKSPAKVDGSLVGIAIEEPAAQGSSVVDLAHASTVGVSVEKDAGPAAAVQEPVGLIARNLTAFVDDAATLCDLGFASGVKGASFNQKRFAANPASARIADLPLKQAQFAFVSAMNGGGQRVASLHPLVLGENALVVVCFSS